MSLAETLALEWKEWPSDSVSFIVEGNQSCTRAEWQAAVDALNQSELDAVLAKNEQLAAARAERIPVWNGEGLPPVGIECEWHPNVHGWVKVKILGRDGSDTWYRASGEEHSQTCRNMAFFRPIRTAEQVAAEEREKAIKDMMEVTSDGISCIGQDDALALYKAGYRKEKKPCGF